jgi:phosphoribosylformimino-5-aminoimidazole carboxamide ribotide isomerase
MLLIVPLVEITDGRCLHRVRRYDGSLGSDDPVETVRLWRKENAKFLHLTDLDGAREGRMVNLETLRRVAGTVDIPIEYSGGVRTVQDVERAFEAGAQRVVITTMAIERPEDVPGVLETFGASKLVMGLEVRDGVVVTRGMAGTSGLSPLAVALSAKQMGFRRLLYHEAVAEGSPCGPPELGEIRAVAEKSGLRVTVSGSVNGLEDLLKVQELEPSGIDSVIIGAPFYENRFSCQGLWRLCEAGDYPFTAKL